MKLALGTTQFGMDYGINNKGGKVPKQEVFKILEKTLSSKVGPVDTAFEYGDSEKVIGDFSREGRRALEIVSKLPKCGSEEAAKFLKKSLENLNTERLYGYLVHDFDSFLKEPAIWEKMQGFKEQGKAGKIGFSLYYPKQAEELLGKGIEFDLVQLPYSIFDQRFSEILPKLKEQGIEVHVRSVFLQGLMFKESRELQGNLAGAGENLTVIKQVSKESNVPVSALCINFAALNQSIDKVVVGVDSLQNLEENIGAFSYQNKVKDVLPKLVGLRINNESIVVPDNWKN